MSNKIVIIPCSGIGKPYGTIGRDATYIVCDEKLRENTETDCLGLLVIEDEEIVEKVRSCKVVSVDGCFNECARKSVERVGAEVTEAIHVWIPSSAVRIAEGRIPRNHELQIVSTLMVTPPHPASQYSTKILRMVRR